MKFLVFILAAIPALLAQDGPEAEQFHLRQLLGEAGPGPVEFMRAVETHLSRYPESPRRVELEQALVKAAIDADDERRILLYGERALEHDDGDAQVLERVAQALLHNGDEDAAVRALRHARRLEEIIREVENDEPDSPRARVRWREQIDEGLGRAFVLQARAVGELGRFEEAAALGRKSYEMFPTAESAREAAVWLARAGKKEEAVRRLADAFIIPDERRTEQDRGEIRRQLGELYRELRADETGLGDLVLAAYDSTASLLAERREALLRLDPNSGVSNPMDFVLSGLQGEPLDLSSLRGKVLIFDFWATWCGPCRVQHPLYEEVKSRFRDRPDVVFLSVNTDRDRSVVEPFLEENGWSRTVYFEDGLSQMLGITSIPTTVVANKRGEVSARMVGFVPDRFVEMLTERIKEILEE